jgi:predicted aminopeptidase
MKRLFCLVFSIGFLMLLSGCYYLTEGCNLISLYSSAKNIDTLLQKPDLPEDERDLLLLVKDIKAFAVRELGLKDDKNYTTYVQINRNYLVDVVSACAADSFTQYTWNYLFVGNLPYRGYFNPADAQNEAERLKKQGYDVYVRQVDAFSTLGFFKDPVFSFMKDYPLYYLANIIIHEQTHATFFLNSNVEFSENLANFFGNQGAKQYLREKFGEQSEQYTKTARFQEDLTSYQLLLKKLRNELQAVYDKNEPRDLKLAQKAETILRWKEDVKANYDKYFKTPGFKHITEIDINNAFLATNMNYSARLDLFDELYKVCGYDLKEVMRVVKGVKDYRGDPYSYLESYVQNARNRGRDTQ